MFYLCRYYLVTLSRNVFYPLYISMQNLKKASQELFIIIPNNHIRNTLSVNSSYVIRGGWMQIKICIVKRHVHTETRKKYADNVSFFDSIYKDCPLFRRCRYKGDTTGWFSDFPATTQSPDIRCPGLIIQIGAYFTAVDVFRARHKARESWKPRLPQNIRYPVVPRKWRDLFLSLICFWPASNVGMTDAAKLGNSESPRASIFDPDGICINHLGRWNLWSSQRRSLRQLIYQKGNDFQGTPICGRLTTWLHPWKAFDARSKMKSNVKRR